MWVPCNSHIQICCVINVYLSILFGGGSVYTFMEGKDIISGCCLQILIKGGWYGECSFADGGCLLASVYCLDYILVLICASVRNKAQSTIRISP